MVLQKLVIGQPTFGSAYFKTEFELNSRILFAKKEEFYLKTPPFVI